MVTVEKAPLSIAQVPRVPCPWYAPKFGVPEVSASTVLLAFAVSLVIGFVAGGYPALRAARLHPIDALRY